MNERIELGSYNILPPVVKNLLIINGLFYVAKVILLPRGIDMDLHFGLHYLEAPHFKIWQIFTYMFMHGNFGHLFFNMFSLWMFGAAIENLWGSKKFLVYYLITGIGAAIIHYIIIYFQIHQDVALFNLFLENPTIQNYQNLAENVQSIRIKSVLQNNLMVLQANPDSLNELSIATVNIKDSFLNSFNIIGASGSVFGILLAFGMLFPNALLYIYFLFPIKAKWFVIIYGALELLYGVTGTSDGIAHFAHLGGMLFGLILIIYWKKKRTLY
ncbi:MAG: rhomboid family intramembrane serine protease [Bacteroidales bacterium]|jgi:membrane associated rhomboid family serine protease|nr:rhomboid family intramembrane serine protease [Bacteroidales bacterium]